MSAAGTVLHLAPHPDDELVGAGATLLALRDAGHRIVDVACGLGRPADHARRRAELEEACARAGFALVVLEPPLALSAGDDLAAAEERLVHEVARLLDEHAPDVVVSPSPHDGHHAHELVGRAARRAIEAAGAPRWWMWGFWADLPLPTLLVPFDEARLAEVQHALAAHAGELARNDFRRAVEGRAVANAVLGAERVFGSGAAADPDVRLAELLTEAVPAGGGWRLGQARVLDPSDPFADPSPTPLDWWLDQASVHDALRSVRPRPEVQPR